MVFRIVYAAVSLPILILVTVVAVYFHPLLGALLTAQAIITSYRPVYGVALLFAVLPIDLVRPVFGGIYVSFSEFALAVVASAWFLGAALQKKRIWLAALPWALPYLGAVFLSGILNRGLIEAVAHTIRNSELMVGLLLAVNVFAGGRQLRPARLAIAWAAVFYSFGAFLQLSSGTRVFPFFHNPNQFGAYVNIVLPFCWSLCLTADHRRARLGYLYVTLLLVGAQLLTMSKGSLLAMAVILIVVFLIQRNQFWKIAYGRNFPLRRWVRNLSVHAILLFLLLPASALLLPHSRPIDRLTVLVRRLRSFVGSRTFEDRIWALELGSQLWSSAPIIGVGPGNYPRVIAATVEAPPEWLRIHVHNQYLQVAIEFGVLGLAALLYLFSKLTLGLIRAFRDPSSPPEARNLAAGGLGLIVGLVVHGLVDELLSNHAMEIGLLLGMALAVLADPKRGTPSQPVASVVNEIR